LANLHLRNIIVIPKEMYVCNFPYEAKSTCN